MRNFQARLQDRIIAATGSRGYAAYLRVRNAVLPMMNEWETVDRDLLASDYWREELEGFQYLFDASPLLIDNLREQCYHITGIKSYEYRSHHAHAKDQFAAKLELLRGVDPVGLFVPEAEVLGGFGFDVGPGRVNVDTLKFYEFMIGLARAGLLERDAGRHRQVLEIGSGWGGFGYVFKTLQPDTTYWCVDLPQTMLFSATYLMAAMPQARVALYGEPEFEAALASPKDFDFVFVPHYHFPRMSGLSVDLALNMVSFQEMTSEHVSGYARKLADLGCPHLYSLNRDRSKHNTQLSTVSENLETAYDLAMIEVLPGIQYTQLAPPKKQLPLGVLDYRHYHGRLRGAA